MFVRIARWGGVIQDGVLSAVGGASGGTGHMVDGERQRRKFSDKVQLQVGKKTKTYLIGLVNKRLTQAWANYGLGTICGPGSFSIRPAELEETILIVCKS